MGAGAVRLPRREGATLGLSADVEGYSRMLQHFFARVGKPPDRITGADVFGWAYGVGLSGRPPSQVTIGARLACLSSFYRFLIRMELVAANPCDQLERPRVSPSPPRGLSADEIRRLLAVTPPTPVGLRDRAIILTLVLTGRRRAEVLGLRVKDLIHEDGRVYYSYRGKGGKRGKRELPEPAFDALTAALSALGHDVSAMAPEASLWPARAGDTHGITSGTFYGISSGTSASPACRPPASTSSATPQRSSGGTPASPSRT